MRRSPGVPRRSALRHREVRTQRWRLFVHLAGRRSLALRLSPQRRHADLEVGLRQRESGSGRPQAIDRAGGARRGPPHEGDVRRLLGPLACPAAPVPRGRHVDRLRDQRAQAPRPGARIPIARRADRLHAQVPLASMPAGDTLSQAACNPLKQDNKPGASPKLACPVAAMSMARYRSRAPHSSRRPAGGVRTAPVSAKRVRTPHVIRGTRMETDDPRSPATADGVRWWIPPRTACSGDTRPLLRSAQTRSQSSLSTRTPRPDRRK